MNVNSFFARRCIALRARWHQVAVTVALLATLLVPWLIGLKAGLEAELYPVTGTVSVDDVVPAGAVLRLHPVKPHHWVYFSPAATVADDGSFRVKTLGFRDGAPAGKYSVTIAWLRNVVTDNGFARGENILPVRYASLRTTPLNVHVMRRPNELPPIAISCRLNEAPLMTLGRN